MPLMQKQVLVKIYQISVITIVIIKEALHFNKYESFLSDDDCITEMKWWIQIISVVLILVILRLQNTEFYANLFRKLARLF